jgi:hypothetical protein
MQAQVIVDDAQSILNDSNVSFPISEILDAINDGQRFIAQYRPDASSSTTVTALILGSKQRIPTTSRRLIDIVRNMGADGSTSGKAVRASLSMRDMDNINPDWHTTTGTDVTEYFFDETRPEEFYIYPQPTLPHFVEIKAADIPIEVTATIDNIGIDEIYAPQLVSWVCYRMFSKDTSDADPGMAERHKAMVYETLGIKAQSDASISPNRN